MWIEFGVAIGVTLALFAVFGYPLVWALGARGFAAVALAAPAAVTVIGGTAILAGFVNVPWNVLPVLVMTGVGTGVLLFVTRRFGRREDASREPWLWVASGLGMVVIAGQVIAAIGEPSNISQTFDNVFHLNAVRYAMNEGTASSLEIGLMTNPEGQLAFYPAGWHGLVSLVAQLTGQDIPVAVSAVTLCIAALIWPLGIAYLVRVLFGARPAAIVAAGVLSSALPVFPLLLMGYGVLYPYQLGLAMVPSALAVTAHSLRIGASSGGLRVWQDVVLLVALLGGIAIAHPGGFVAWLALSVPLFGVYAVRVFVAGGTRTRLAVIAGVALYLAAGVLLLKALRPPLPTRQWPTVLTTPDAIREVLVGSAWYGVPAALVTLTLAAGFVTVLVRRTPAALASLAMFAIAGLLYVAVASFSAMPNLRDALTGSWYNNTPRLAALLPLAAVPLCALGVDGLVSALRRVLPSLERSRPLALGVGGVVVLLAVLWTQAGPLSPVPTALERTHSVYDDPVGSELVDDDERALLERVDDEVPEGVAIAGSPWTGASMVYALADRPVLMPHLLMETSPDIDLVNSELREAEPGAPVCRAIERLGVGYVLDFGHREVHGGEHIYPGLEDLEDSDAVELVDQQGEARLYRVTACG